MIMKVFFSKGWGVFKGLLYTHICLGLTTGPRCKTFQRPSLLHAYTLVQPHTSLCLKLRYLQYCSSYLEYGRVCCLPCTWKNQLWICRKIRWRQKLKLLLVHQLKCRKYQPRSAALAHSELLPAKIVLKICKQCYCHNCYLFCMLTL